MNITGFQNWLEVFKNQYGDLNMVSWNMGVWNGFNPEDWFYYDAKNNWLLIRN